VSSAVDSLQRTRQREAAQVNDVLEVMTSLASLDFHARARVLGDGPLDALAQVANMLSEELQATQEAMATARAAAEAATEAKSRFLAHMSHEIRTPLTALLGFADLLLAPKLTESERLNYAMIIRRNGEHLLSVINDILDLSRVEAGRLHVERVPCSPARILSDVASLLRGRADEVGLHFEAHLVTPIPAVVVTDPTRIRQILLNFVGNAVKFTRKGAVRVLARVDGVHLVVEVVDTGIGIAPEHLPNLFHAFTQGDLSMARRFGGSGLGLAISKALAEALGGSISVDSELGRGSTFRLSLPIESGDSSETVDALPVDFPAPLAAPPRLAGSVLVAEDGVDNQVLATILLRSYGLTVAVAADGEMAVQRTLEAWRHGTPFDVVLMDMQMPVLDGYQATTSLRRAGYDRPIVALTAHAMAGERERCIEAGCDDYIRKPIDRRELLQSLRRHLQPPTAEGAATALLHSSFADDSEMVEIIQRFVASLPERVAALRAEARVPGSQTLVRLAHQLKGAAGGYGFGPISEAAATLEAAARSGGEHANVLRAVEELADVCARARTGRS
jgi:signal transduction histidine kinase/CheY-like chemotaxis protein/HPt (histidine-containing phosphotransfer) domain-containing protein